MASIQNKLRELSSSLWWLAKDQWFVGALGVLILIASQVQVPSSQQDIKSTSVSYLSVIVVFLVTGCTLDTRVLLNNYARWKLHLFVQVQCFLIVSAIMFGVVSACATNRNFMDPGFLIGMIMLGTLPTTISSNVVMTQQAHGNTALTVVQTTIGNFLGPFLSPVLIQMYTSAGAWYTEFLPPDSGNYSEIYRRVFKQLGLSIFLPMVVGQIIRNIFPNPTYKVFTQWKLSKLSSLALLTLVWSSFDQAFESGAFGSAKGSNMIFLVFMSIGLWTLWLAVSICTSLLWLPKRDVISIAFCVPAKTLAVGVPLSMVMYSGLTRAEISKLQIPQIIFQGFNVAMSSFLTIPFRRWIKPDEEAEENKALRDDSEESQEA